ncbi:MAG: MauE/DoxX family redox-associated membrane protein [Acidimicrobiales bacterium]
MSTIAAGPLLAVAGLVAAAGAAKVVRPGPTARALRSAGLPGSPALGRVLGGVELVVAVAAIATGSRPTALVVVATYLAFAAFSLRLIARQGPDADCGCFGQESSPVTSLHVALNLGAAGLAAWAAVSPPGRVTAVLADQPLAGVPFVALALLAVWSGYAAFALLPQLGPPAVGSTGSTPA